MPVASCVATGTACGRLRSLLAREVFPFPPSPPSLPQRAFSGGTRTFNLFNWKIALERFTFEKGETRGGSTAPPHRKWADKPQLSRPPIFRLHCRPARSPLPPLAADAAMARARRRSRTHEGRTERRSRRGHHPAGTAGKVRADAPRATRRAGYSPTQETNFAFPHKGEYGGAGGVEGQPPLSPHAPRRAGDPPPTPGRSRDAQRDTGSIRPGRFTFFKVELL